MGRAGAGVLGRAGAAGVLGRAGAAAVLGRAGAGFLGRAGAGVLGRTGAGAGTSLLLLLLLLLLLRDVQVSLRLHGWRWWRCRRGLLVMHAARFSHACSYN